MPAIRVDLPESETPEWKNVHTLLKMRAAKEGKTLKALVIELLAEAVAVASADNIPDDDASQ